MSSRLDETVHQAYHTKPSYRELMPGVPDGYQRLRTLGDLLSVNYRYATVEEQLRGNLIAKLRSGENPYPGIIGYDDDVIPAVNRAILSGHDILLVGQIGQAKTKIAESIAKNLLSPIPVVRGTSTSDIPTTIPEDQLASLLAGKDPPRILPEFNVSRECEEIIKSDKLETKIDWISGAARYKYILATPDISVKDLVGQIDAIRIAKKGVELYSIDSYAAGQLLLARHGILCIDEMPVLDPRKQVALLSVLQEGKFTTGAYPVVFKPDVKIVATANPIDYTHSGKIIEPLFDRFRSHVDTHYPKTVDDEMLILVQEAKVPPSVTVPEFMFRIIANITHSARSHTSINQDKGVSVRMAIHCLEVLASEAERTRGIEAGAQAVPRICDLLSIKQSSKFELAEMEDTRDNRYSVLVSLIDAAVESVSSEYGQILQPDAIAKIKSDFSRNKSFIVSQGLPWAAGKGDSDYQSQLAKFPALKSAVKEAIALVKQNQKRLSELAKNAGISSESLSLADSDGELEASAVELVMESLRHTKPPVLEKKENSYVTAQ